MIESIEGASAESVTDLYFFLNKDKPDKNHKTGKEAKYIQEIEDAAKKYNIKIYWWTKSKIEGSLDLPKFNYIKSQYHLEISNDGVDKRFRFRKNIEEYYNYVKSLYRNKNIGNELLGEESLEELYMQPSYHKSEKETGDVEQLFEEFIANGESGVLWIVGEPGHGKTSMCIKAVADYVNGKRYRQAGGVFWFRLNPQGVPKMVGNQVLALEEVFSWGLTEGNRNKTIESDQMRGSLVFLDGFDELKSSLEMHGIMDNQFYAQANQLAEANKCIL